MKILASLKEFLHATGEKITPETKITSGKPENVETSFRNILEKEIASEKEQEKNTGEPEETNEITKDKNEKEEKPEKILKKHEIPAGEANTNTGERKNNSPRKHVSEETLNGQFAAHLHGEKKQLPETPRPRTKENIFQKEKEQAENKDIFIFQIRQEPIKPSALEITGIKATSLEEKLNKETNGTKKSTGKENPVTHLQELPEKKTARDIIEELARSYKTQQKETPVKTATLPERNKEEKHTAEKENAGKTGSKIEVFFRQSPLREEKPQIPANKIQKDEKREDARPDISQIKEKPLLRELENVKIQQNPSSLLNESIKEAIEEMVSRAKIHLGKNEFSAQIRMNPSYFGFMSIDARFENQHLVLKILVDNPNVYQKLQEQIEVIKSEFFKEGILVDQVFIRFRDRETGASFPQQDSSGYFYTGTESNHPEHHNPYLFDNEQSLFSFHGEREETPRQIEESYELTVLNTTTRTLDLWG